MNPVFKGKTVLVTGAGGGLGRAIALAAGRAGGNLVLGDISAARLADTASRLEEHGIHAVGEVCDVRRQEDLSTLFAEATARFGYPDVVFAGAGVKAPPTSIWHYSEADFSRVMDVHVTGTWRTIKTALPGMLKRGSGVIVATTPVAGCIGASRLAAFVASRHAVVGLVKATALEVGGRGIRINALCPGMVDSEMVDLLAESPSELLDELMAFNPSKRIGSMGEIADAAVWIASDDASYVTGHALAVDGGIGVRGGPA